MPPEAIAQVRRDYLQNQAMVTSPTEIVHLLYKVAIDNMNKALDCLKSGDALARARAVTKAEEAVDELILALDHSAGAQFTRTLADLYAYILQQMMNGHARQSEQAFRDALTILESLSETWSQLRAKLNADAEAKDAPESGAVSDATKDAIALQRALQEDSTETTAVAKDSHDPYSAYNAGCPVTPGRDWSA